jgi:hypothetical protein
MGSGEAIIVDPRGIIDTRRLCAGESVPEPPEPGMATAITLPPVPPLPCGDMACETEPTARREGCVQVSTNQSWGSTETT